MEEEKEKEKKEVMTESEKAVREQLTFYFSDYNLPTDSFLKLKISQDGNGYVDLSLILTFKKMAGMGTSVEKIGEILTKFPSEVIELSEDKKRVKRKQALPEVLDSVSRTIYLKGFIGEKFEDAEKFVRGKWGDMIGAVRKRMFYDQKTKQKVFKGSMYVEMKSKEDVQKATSDELLKYGDKDITIMTKTQHLEQQSKEREQKKRDRVKMEYNTKLEEVKKQFASCTVKISNIVSKDDESIGFKNVKQKIIEEFKFKDNDVKVFVEFPVEVTNAHVRFPEKDAAAAFVKFVGEKDSKFVLGKEKVVVTLLTGEDENEFLKKLTNKLIEENEPRRKKYKRKRR